MTSSRMNKVQDFLSVSRDLNLRRLMCSVVNWARFMMKPARIVVHGLLDRVQDAGVTGGEGA